jgi:hypothetical protein
MSVFFNGRLWVSPVTASIVDDSAMNNTNVGVSNVLAIIGKSEGGQPFTALSFGSATEARAALISGESLKAIENAFDPSAQTTGPSTVIFVRVNPAVQSTLSLLDAAGLPSIDLASQDWGLHANGIKFKIETASANGKKVTSQFGNNYYSADNIYRNALSVSYSGASLTATISVDANTATLKYGTTTSVIDLNSFNTIGSLVDRINAEAGFSAAVLDGNIEGIALNGLDFIANQDVKAAPFTVTANLQAVVDWINGTGEGYVTATRSVNALAIPANLPFTYLAAGTDGMVTMNEWQAAYDALQSVDAQWVVPISPMPAIHAMNDSHCSYMSNIARMERRGIVGGNIGTTDLQAIAAAKALNSDRTSYTHLGFYDYDTNGKLTLYPPYIMAGLLAGMFSGVNPGTALTNKSIKIRGIERNLRNPTDTDILINGGVLCAENTKKGYKVVKSITTWLVNNNYNRVEVSVGVACDFTSRAVRDAVDDLRGAKGSPSLLADAISRVETALRQLSVPEPMGPGVLVGDKLNPPYKNITANLSGDVLRIEYQASPVIPANYILLVMHAVPYSGSASL